MVFIMITLIDLLIPQNIWPIKQPTLFTLGMLGNLLAIVVLTKPHMRSPTNFLLTSLAVGDLCGLTAGLILYIKNLTFWCDPSALAALGTVLIHRTCEFCNSVFNGWLTVAIAVTRFYVVRQMSFVFTFKQAKLTVLAVVIFSAIQTYTFLIPTEFFPIWVGDKSCFFIRFDFVDPILIRFLEENVSNGLQIVLLIIFSVLLISFMFKSRKRHAEIMNSTRAAGGWRKTNRTTAILLAVVAVALVTRLTCVSASFIHFFFDRRQINHMVFKYMHLAQGIMFSLNSGLNIFFYMMSGEFRKTLESMLFCRVPSGRSMGV